MDVYYRTLNGALQPNHNLLCLDIILLMPEASHSTSHHFAYAQSSMNLVNIDGLNKPLILYSSSYKPPIHNHLRCPLTDHHLFYLIVPWHSTTYIAKLSHHQ